MTFHFGQDCLELRLSALATEIRRRGTCVVMRWKCTKACVLFNVKPDTVQKDYIMYVW